MSLLIEATTDDADGHGCRWTWMPMDISHLWSPKKEESKVLATTGVCVSTQLHYLILVEY